MTSSLALPRYDTSRSYQWNYEHAPEPPPANVPPLAGPWPLGRLNPLSPLGIAAGPLLNGRWLLYYAALGFDLLTYKTVRSRPWPCYELPNLQPVNADSLRGGEAGLPASAAMEGSWAVSFGMPSRSPDEWRADVAAARDALPAGKLLSVSVVASAEPGWTLDELAADYALCARWAIESGADLVELNFSCPNVTSADAQLYQQPRAAAAVAEHVRAALGPAAVLWIKLGHVPQPQLAGELVAALAPSVDALVMTNCVPATVAGADGRPLFAGARRGIAGRAIREASLRQVRAFAAAIREQGSKMSLVGVGGIATADDVQSYLQAGAQAVQLATAAMLDPAVGLAIRRQLRETTSNPG